jgi:hypothetical protein
MTFQEGRSYRGRRKIFVPAGPGRYLDRLRIFASSQPGKLVVVSDVIRGPNTFFRTPVPTEALAAFEAGEDPRPLIDWLLDRYPELEWVNKILHSPTDTGKVP